MGGRLNRGQRVAILIGAGIALVVLGRWVTSVGTHAGWVGYAPLTSQGSPSPGGLHSWVRLVIWLALVLAWTVLAVAMLRVPRKPEPPDPI